MTIIGKGSNVKIHYKGTLDDGTEFDSSHKRNQTLNFTVGAGTLLPAFEEAVIGMTAGDTKTFRLTATQAYGPRYDEAVRTVPKSAFPPDMAFTVGGRVGGTNANGQQIVAIINEVNDNDVVLDHNHPLAGKDINFQVEIVDVNSTDTTETE